MVAGNFEATVGVAHLAERQHLRRHDIAQAHRCGEITARIDAAELGRGIAERHFRTEGYAGGDSQVIASGYTVAEAVAAMDRMKQLVANLKATVVIQHDVRDIGKLPAFPAAAK